MLRLAGLIIAASLLTACSAVKLAYNQAPDLTYWWLDGYFDFNDQQTPQVRDALTAFFAWHRSSELPKTADLLSQAAQLASGEISAQQACRIYGQGRGLLDNITQQALPAFAAIAPSITPEQIAHLKRKYAKNVEEFKRDFLHADLASREAKSLKRAVERSEMLYGKLEEAQKVVIKQVLAGSSFDAAWSMKERERRQSELIELLGSLSSAKVTQASSQHALRIYIQRVWESPDLAYRAHVQRLTAQACQSFATIHASTTAGQRANAVKVLQGYEADLRALAASR